MPNESTAASLIKAIEAALSSDSMPTESTTASLIKASEAALNSDVSLNTVHRRIRDGSLPAVKVGQCHMVYPDDVARLFTPTPVVPLNAAAPEVLLAAIAKAVAAAPPMTPAVRDRIISLLGGTAA